VNFRKRWIRDLKKLTKISGLIILAGFSTGCSLIITDVVSAHANQAIWGGKVTASPHPESVVRNTVNWELRRQHNQAQEEIRRQIGARLLNIVGDEHK
jgi:hypothetical protein